MVRYEVPRDGFRPVSDAVRWMVSEALGEHYATDIDEGWMKAAARVEELMSTSFRQDGPRRLSIMQ